MAQNFNNFDNVMQFIYNGDMYIKDTNTISGGSLIGRYALILYGIDKGKVGMVTHYQDDAPYRYVIDGHFHTREEFTVVTKIESDVYHKDLVCSLGDGVLCSSQSHLETINRNNYIKYKDMNLIDKIRVNIKGEPMKTLIKNEILTLDERLTSTGNELFTDFLYAKFKDEFVADLAPKLEGLTLEK